MSNEPSYQPKKNKKTSLTYRIGKRLSTVSQVLKRSFSAPQINPLPTDDAAHSPTLTDTPRSASAPTTPASSQRKSSGFPSFGMIQARLKGSGIIGSKNPLYDSRESEDDIAYWQSEANDRDLAESSSPYLEAFAPEQPEPDYVAFSAVDPDAPAPPLTDWQSPRQQQAKRENLIRSQGGDIKARQKAFLSRGPQPSLPNEVSNAAPPVAARPSGNTHRCWLAKTATDMAPKPPGEFVDNDQGHAYTYMTPEPEHESSRNANLSAISTSTTPQRPHR